MQNNNHKDDYWDQKSNVWTSENSNKEKENIKRVPNQNHKAEGYIKWTETFNRRIQQQTRSSRRKD